MDDTSAPASRSSDVKKEALVQALQHIYLLNSQKEEQRQAALFGQLELNYSMFCVLRYLCNRPEGAEPSVLADALFIPRPTVTSLVDRLQKRGLIQRLPHPNDRRRLIVKLLPEGEAVAKKAMELSYQYHSRTMAHFSAEELERYIALRTQMAEIRDQVLQEILAEQSRAKQEQE